MRGGLGEVGGRRVLVAHPSAELYGSDRVMLESVTGLLAADWQVLVALPGPGPLVAAVTERGARVVFCPSPVLRKSAMRPIGLLRFGADVVRGVVAGLVLLRRTRPDAVYVSTLTVPLWLILARLTGAATVCHVHEAEASASAPIRTLLALPVLLADRVLTNSKFSHGVLADSFATLGRRTTVVYNGVPGPAVAEAARERLENPLRLVYVGRLSARKGPDLLLDAVAILLERGQDAHAVLVGAAFPGNEVYQLGLRERVRELRLDDRIAFRGFTPDVWPALAHADIAVVPSRVDEPFGNTAVEAVLARRPVVVSDTSGLREASAHAASAVRVRPGDAVALADGIAEIASDWPRYRRLAEAAALRYAQLFSVQSYGRAVVSCIDELVRGKAIR